MNKAYFTNLDIVEEKDTGDWYLYVSGKYYQLHSFYESKASKRSKSNFTKIGSLQGIQNKARDGEEECLEEKEIPF